MQAECSITFPPVVSYSLVALNDERINSQHLESCSNIQTTLRSADYDHGGFLVKKFSFPLTLISPFTMVRLKVPQRSNMLWETLRIFEVGVDYVGLPRAIWKRDEPEYARGMTHIGIKK